MTENDVFMTTFARSCILCFLFDSPENESVEDVFLQITDVAMHFNETFV